MIIDRVEWKLRLDYFYNYEPVNDFLREIDRKVENKYVFILLNAYARKQSGFDLSPIDKSNVARPLLLFMEFALRHKTLGSVYYETTIAKILIKSSLPVA